MNNKKRLGAWLLAGSMIVGVSSGIWAAEESIPAVDELGKVSIVKDFEIAEGANIPQVMFEFTAEAITKDAPIATIQNISYGSTDEKGEAANGKYTITKNSEIVFGEFPHAGVFEYSVKETPGNVEGITYCEKIYNLRVYVANKEDGSVYVKSITANDGQGKKEKVLFTNTYVKNNASLIIKKETTGDMADKTKAFSFTIQFTKSSLSDQTTFTGKIGEMPINCENGKETEFKLRHGQQLVFDALPVGTHYIVKEKGVKGDGYTPAITVIENGVTTINGVVGNETEDLTSLNNGKNNIVGEGENKVDFVNAYNAIPVTGVLLNNLPFFLLVGIAAVAFGILFFMRIQKTSKKRNK